MSFGRLGSLGRGFGRLGSTHLGGSSGPPVVLPTAPVLAMDPAWVTTDNEPDFTIDVDDTVIAGDDVQLQVAVAGTSFAAPVSDTTHEITAPEDAANEIDLSLAALPNGDYEARARVTDGVLTSNWSNTVPFTIAAASGGGAAILYPFLFV